MKNWKKKWKIDLNKKKLKKIKKLFFSPAQKTIDFRYSQNNILDNDRFKNIKKLKNSYINRLNFEKDLKEKTKRSIVEKILNNFRTMIEKSIRKREEENYIKSQNRFIPMLYEKEKSFNKNICFSKLNTISLETSLKISEQHKRNLEIDTPLIKKITYEIIDIWRLFISNKNEKELLDLP